MNCFEKDFMIKTFKNTVPWTLDISYTLLLVFFVVKELLERSTQKN